MFALYEFASYHSYPYLMATASSESDMFAVRTFVGVVDSIDEAINIVKERASFSVKSLLKIYKTIPENEIDNLGYGTRRVINSMGTWHPEWRTKSKYKIETVLCHYELDGEMYHYIIARAAAAYSVKYQLIEVKDYNELIHHKDGLLIP